MGRRVEQPAARSKCEKECRTLQSAVAHIESEPAPQPKETFDCHRCDLLEDCTLNPARGRAKQGRFENLKLAMAMGLMRCGDAVFNFGLRRLHPDCPLRGSFEALAPLVDTVFSLSSTKRRATS
jgi:hypothetical protein